jgi:glycine/D-amino acid oxidase-like deaminating enzyme
LINYIPTQSHELFKERKSDKALFEKVMDHEGELNDIIAEATGIENNYSQVANTFGFKQIHKIIRNKGEGQIDTGLMMQRLHQLAVSVGVLILFDTEYKGYKEANSITVTTNHGTFETEHLIFATNGLSKLLLPNLDIQPARAQVIITQPLKHPIEGTFHYDRGYYYFRNVGNRMLIGGGRNLAIEEETSIRFENTELITNELKRLLSDVILHHQSFEIAQQWSGIMGIGKNRKPIVEFINPKKTIVAAIRLGGMGVALGSHIGEQVAILIENQTTP